MPDFIAIKETIQQSIRAVPVVKYAMGLTGIAAAFALIRGFFPDVGLTAMMPLLIGAIVLMAVLAIFALSLPRQTFSATTADGRIVETEEPKLIGKVFLWSVCIFVIIFLLFTVTAVAVGWPENWTRIILPQSAADRSLVAAASGDGPKPTPVEGFVYYGRQDENRTSDDGKLRPENNGPLPSYQDISVGAHFQTTEGVNLRTKPTSDSASLLDKQLAVRSCVEVLREPTNSIVDLPPESGGWLFVKPVSCNVPQRADPAPKSSAPANITADKSNLSQSKWIVTINYCGAGRKVNRLRNYLESDLHPEELKAYDVIRPDRPISNTVEYSPLSGRGDAERVVRTLSERLEINATLKFAPSFQWKRMQIELQDEECKKLPAGGIWETPQT